ncbi:ATP synthase protein I [Salmonella enterica subsp. enterica serovar Hvittingfoss str. A4-620]|nr:ATP synthase protein I [Salmonella enterica subsp. enterica serovar Hvittingfoss str. A4-620]
MTLSLKERFIRHAAYLEVSRSKNVMSVSLVSRNVARKLLFIQFLAVIASGLLFCLKDPFWGISAVCGGLAVALPSGTA